MRAALLVLCAQVAAAAPATFVVQGDGIPAPLTNVPADAARGRRIVVDRTLGACVLCHAGPFPEEPIQSDIAPNLAGVGDRLTQAQLRLRLVDPQFLAPDSIMPASYRTEGLSRVGDTWRGKPMLTAQQIEDIVAYLSTLHAP